MYLTNAAHEHFTTQTGKKSKTALKNFMGPGSRGAEGGHMGPRAEKNKYPNTKKNFVDTKNIYIRSNAVVMI